MERFNFKDREPVKRVTILHPEDLLRQIRVKDCKLKTLELPKLESRKY